MKNRFGTIWIGQARGRRILAAVLAVIAVVWMVGINQTQARAERPPQDKPLLAAFVRGGALWMKENDNERQLTRAEHVRSPEWSHDGQWLAYSTGETAQQLWMLHAPTRTKHVVETTGIFEGGYKWSPRSGLLAYLKDQRLYVVGQQEGAQPVEVTRSVGKISSFAWLPEGDGFVVSTQAELLPDGWTPVRLMRIKMPVDGGSAQADQLYVLPTQLNELPVVGTSTFKWSATGKWMAFLATPTASLSADSNTLCVLSADGATFKPVDQMANNADWFQWSMEDDKLAYIGGIGREATSNKQLRVTSVPDIQPRSDFTPAGYVDQALTWRSPVDIVVSRAKAVTADESPAQKPFPFLVNVRVDGERQKRITKSAAGYGDYGPESLGVNGLGWVRSNRSMANVLVAAPGQSGNRAVRWIADIDQGSNYYEQWDWHTVLRFFVR
ncbi:PD40 domain-containing protein [Paenibacillus montanisoli]|nr:PD40 domain-containing protein [Paenibacillus montanisoli]